MADRTLVRDFTSDLFAFGAAVESQALGVFKQAADTTAEALVVGNEFGPGAPLRDGFLQSGFRMGLNAPVPGPVSAPRILSSQRNEGVPIYREELDTTAIGQAKLGDALYVTTNVEYAGYLEEDGLTRRNGPPENVGADTAFLAPVVERFDRIANDAADRVGYGR